MPLTQMKLGHKDHLNTRNKFPKEFFFLNPNIFLPILDELENLGFERMRRGFEGMRRNP
jgi:hypothetical protein